jgi:hypothetical protein
LNEIYDKIINEPLKLPEKLILIGFAETATGLGYSVFNCFNDNCEYIHTTRENITEKLPRIHFKEEHSHAIDHIVYPLNSKLFYTDCPVLLIDDEFTTGKTVLNIIKEIHKICPRKNYIIMSILDWRNQKDIDNFTLCEKELGITISSVALLRGNFKIIEAGSRVRPYKIKKAFSEDNICPDIEEIILSDIVKTVGLSSVDSKGIKTNIPYVCATGRFCIDKRVLENDYLQFDSIAKKLLKKRSGKKTLCLGTGEFIFIPMIIASKMGTDIYYQSTTRSPIIPNTIKGYAIHNAYSFKGIEDPNICNYIYNIPENFYEDVFVFLERDIDASIKFELIKILKNVGINNIKFVIFVGNN